MQIDRRSFLVGVAATVAASAAPAVPAQELPPPCFVPSVSPRFSPDTEWQLGHRAIERFMRLSRWHFDPETYPGHHLIRHEGTGLTFRIEEDADFQVYVRRVFLRSDPADLAYSRYLIVGNATRRAAKAHWPGMQKCGIQCFDYVTDPHSIHLWQGMPRMQLDTAAFAQCKEARTLWLSAAAASKARSAALAGDDAFAMPPAVALS
jgi:hypothetical protein